MVCRSATGLLLHKCHAPIGGVRSEGQLLDIRLEVNQEAAEALDIEFQMHQLRNGSICHEYLTSC